MFENSVKLFSIYDFDIKVDPSWVLIAALITWSLSQQFFPEKLPGADGGVYFVMAIVAMLGLFASLLLHELAHSVVARHLGVSIKSITLFLFGGVAELDTEPASARAEFWIAVAGPAMSICLAVVFWTLEQMLVWSGFPAASVEIVSYLALINLVLALFNLLPAFPLDGGRVLRAVLWSRSGDVADATRLASRSGSFLGYALMGLGVVALFRGMIVSGLWQMMIGGFLLVAARASYAQQLAKAAFANQTVDALMTHNPIIVGPEMTLSEFVNQIMLQRHVSFVPVMESDVLLGHIDSSVLSKIDRENWANTRVGDVFVGLIPDAMIGADLPVQDVLDRISKTGRRKFMVVSGHDLLGVITLSDLTRHLRSSEKTPHVPPSAIHP
ncbi:site-2 protease family protein [Tateyamaria armeniaca]|uniref:Zinc metalloprotease n=1 Tax=Tateyamaria armeniaca TaxID=2518930 RepID=A0ABW8UW25_9RHOB